MSRHMPPWKSGGRSLRQPGQVLTEAATTNSLRVVPASTFSRDRAGRAVLRSGLYSSAPPNVVPAKAGISSAVDPSFRWDDRGAGMARALTEAERRDDGQGSRALSRALVPVPVPPNPAGAGPAAA